MRKIVALVLALALVFRASLVACAEEKNPIETYEDLVFYCNYACMTYPYVYGGDDSRGSEGYDCTGFVMHVYKLRGIDLDRGSIASKGQVITNVNDAHPGDIVVYGSNRSDPEHVAILLNPDTGELVQANSKKVGIVSMTLANKKEWSCLEGMYSQSGYCWGDGDESADPTHVYIVHIEELKLTCDRPDNYEFYRDIQHYYTP